MDVKGHEMIDKVGNRGGKKMLIKTFFKVVEMIQMLQFVKRK